MAKKWYQYLVTLEGDALPAPEDDPDLDAASASASDATATSQAGAPPRGAAGEGRLGLPTFDDIYAAAQIATPAQGFTILKVADLLKSEHIASLPPEVKKKSVLLALEAAGVALSVVVDDAVKRDRALDAFERTQTKALDALERRVKADQLKVQQDIDALIAEKQAKMKAMSESLAAETAAVRAWKERKAAEEARIAEAVGHFLADNPVTIGPSGPTSSSKT